jgi:4-amino-4-deoxy-L-arabinose transferase-like glycosyltransferase/SAM-dependent methyltransferase
MRTTTHSEGEEKWAAGLPDEIHFWENFFAGGGGEWAGELAQRLDPASPFKPNQRRWIDARPGARLEILDVGAGPLTCLGKTIEGCEVHIAAVDPLAGEYDRILNQHNIHPPVPTIAGQAEKLVDQFGENRFDMVFSRNALDHSADPIVGIRQCLRAAKPGCHVVLMNFLNEAQSQNYQGLHQWNFDNRDGRFVIWNPQTEIDVQQSVSDLCDEIVCESPKPGLVLVAMRKRNSLHDEHGSAVLPSLTRKNHPWSEEPANIARPPRVNRYTFGLIALAALFTGLTALWIHLNQAPTYWDDSWYLIDSLRMFDGLTTSGLRGWLIAYLGAQAGVKAPLMCVLPTPIYLLFGRSLKAAFGIQLTFLPLLLFFVYGIARRLYNPRAALLAVFITGSMPIIYGLATWYDVELGLAALTAMAIWAIIRSDDLMRTRYVLLFSVACGLGMLQKIPFPLYVAPLAGYFLVRWFVRIRRPDARNDPSIPRPDITLTSFCLPALLIASSWYGYNIKGAVLRAIYSGYSHREADLYGTGDPFKFESIRLYFKMIINEGIGPSYFLIAIAVVIALIFVRNSRKLNYSRETNSTAPPAAETKLMQQRWIILAIWMPGFLVFLFGRNKDVRFISPFLLVFSIVLGVGIDRIIARWPRIAWAPVSVALAMPLFFQILICFHPLRDGPAFSLSYPSDVTGANVTQGLRFVSNRIGMARGYDPASWPLDQVVQEVAQVAGGNANQYLYVVVGTDSQDFNSNNLQLAATAARLPLGVGTTAYTDDKNDLDQMIKKCDVYLYRENGQAENLGYNFLRERARRVAKRNGFSENKSSLQFPDGGVLYIYVNRSHLPGPSSAFIPQELGRIDDCDVLFDNKIRLTGLSFSRAGDRFVVRYRWRCDAAVAEQYKCFTHIVDEKGGVLGSIDHDIINGRPSLPSWNVGDRGMEEISFPMSAFPPGDVGRLDIGLYLPRDSSILHATLSNPPQGWSLMPDMIGVHIELPLPAAATTKP